MNFKVVFRPQTGRLVELLSPEGVSVVKEVRKQLNLSHLNPKLIIPERKRETVVIIEVPYEVAENLSSHFENKNEIEVTVNENGFNLFTYYKIDTKVNLENSAIESVKVSWTMDKDFILSSWIQSGAPLNWTIEEI